MASGRMSAAATSSVSAIRSMVGMIIALPTPRPATPTFSLRGLVDEVRCSVCATFLPLVPCCRGPLVSRWTLMAERNLSALAAGLHDREADLERSHAPRAVMDDRLVIHDCVVQLAQLLIPGG